MTARGVTPVFIIAEAGVNHDGSLEKALRLVDIAADAGADAVKFQTFRTEEVASPNAAKADYQSRETGVGSQFDMIKTLELSEYAHTRIVERCQSKNIEFMSTPFSSWGVDLLLGLGMKRIKVASGELVNLPLIRDIAARKLPIILSTGMATLDEVERAVGWIRTVWSDGGYAERPGDLVILHCTSDYPAPPESANLKAMDTLARALALPVGYSDHTLGAAVAIAAVARGAVMIEKHFTIDCAAFGPDHSASLSPVELKTLVSSIRAVERCLGDGVKRPMPNELKTRELVRRSAFAARDIGAGAQIGVEDIAFLRPSGGIGPENIDQLLGSRSSRAIGRGEMILSVDLL